MSDQIVEIMDNVPGHKTNLLDRLYDRAANRYLTLALPDDPAYEGIKKQHQQGFTGKGVKSAVLDTGMMLEHPWIKRTLIESIDLTGEGPSDLNGHGTFSSLILLLTAPGSGLFNIKVIDSTGRGSAENLAKGIALAVEKGVSVMNLSVGIYSTSWGIFKCNGTCVVCKAAEAASKAGVIVCAAAGNKAGETSCPARLGVIKPGSGVIAVGAFDYQTTTTAAYSGTGNIYGPVGPYPLVRAD